jgi:hypothetical protein
MAKVTLCSRTRGTNRLDSKLRQHNREQDTLRRQMDYLRIFGPDPENNKVTYRFFSV